MKHYRVKSNSDAILKVRTGYLKFLKLATTVTQFNFNKIIATHVHINVDNACRPSLRPSPPLYNGLCGLGISAIILLILF